MYIYIYTNKYTKTSGNPERVSSRHHILLTWGCMIHVYIIIYVYNIYSILQHILWWGYIYIYPKADPNNMGLYSMGIAIRWDISQI